MDGIAFCEKLREIPRYEHATCIAVTAFAMPGDKEKLLTVGFDKYISKPIIRTELISILSAESIPF